MNPGVLLDLLYPRACTHCGAPADFGRFFCWECQAEFLYVQPPFCSCCGDPVPGHIDHEYQCVFCSRETPHFELARSAIRYEGAGGQALRALKYQHAIWLVPDLADLLEACLHTQYGLLTFDGVCYVPLHAVKYRERGFNQAELLARALAKRRDWPVLKNTLARTKWRDSQTKLTAPQRAANVKGIFAVRHAERFRNKRLLLVDDVMTTGATVNECARMLKKAGAESVHVLTVARG